MEKEKLIWAGFGVAVMMSLVCLQRPLSLPRSRTSARPPRGDRTGSRPRHITLSHISGGGRTCRSRGSAASRRPDDGRCAGVTNSTISPDQRNLSPPPRETCTNGAPLATNVVAQLAHVSPKDLDVTPSKRTARHHISRVRSANVVSVSASKNKSMAEQSTQTKDCALDELCSTGDLTSPFKSRDILDCISPISNKENYIASPLSHAGVCFGSPVRGKGKKDVSLPPSLERGVELEFTTLVEAVKSPLAGPKAWFELYNFILDIPCCVLQHILTTKKITLSSSLLSAAAELPNDGLDSLRRLQGEVYRCVNGQLSRRIKHGEFKLSEDGAKVLWVPREKKTLENKKKFSHICVSSSDEEGNEGDEDDIALVERVERVLLTRRQARMQSAFTQFPEVSTLGVKEREEMPQAVTPLPFEKEDVMALLRNLAKLRHHAAFRVLQSSGVDLSFLVDIIDVMNEAQRLLDRATLRMGIVLEPAVQLPTHSPGSGAVPTPPPSFPQELPSTADNLLLTPPVTRSAPGEASVKLWCVPFSEQIQASARGGGAVGLGGEKTDSARHAQNVHEKNAATPPRGVGQESFARLLTTSTIPSTVLNGSERRRKLFERSQTHADVGQNADFTSAMDPRSNPQSGRSVFDRLYTPPKATPKPVLQQNSSAAKLKTRFNLYA